MPSGYQEPNPGLLRACAEHPGLALWCGVNPRWPLPENGRTKPLSKGVRHSAEKKAQIYARIAEGVHPTLIAREFGVSTQSVFAWRREANRGAI